MMLAALFDMVSLAHTVQGACMISGFEYPDGFPEQVQNQTVLNHPCPLTPACLFQISAHLEGGGGGFRGLRRVRRFSIPFDIPSHATPGEGYAATSLPQGLGRCPFSPNDCCDFYDSKRQSFCDAMEAEAPWPCFFWELRPPPGSGNSIVDRAELDGAMMEVGSKWRATGLLLQGFLVSVLGLVVLSCRARRVQRAREECAQRLVRSVDHRANAWLLRLARRAARSRWRCVFAVCPVREGLNELLLRDAAAVPLQRAVRRWLRRRHLADAFRSRVINHIEPEETRHEEVKPSTPKDTGPKDTRWVAKGLVAKSAPRNRKLLLDTGSLDNFRRFVRVRVASAPWELLRLEVALEPGAHLGISLATQQKAPPLVCGVRPRSIAEHYGVKRGFVLLKVGRFEWPNFAAREMIQELRSRPLCLILQEAPEPPEPPKLEEPSSAPQPPGMPPVPLELRPLDFGLAPAPLASRVERRFPEPPNRRPQSANASIMRLARERMETAQPRTRAGDEPRRVERRSKGSKVRPGRQSPLRPARPSSAFVRR